MLSAVWQCAHCIQGITTGTGADGWGVSGCLHAALYAFPAEEYAASVRLLCLLPPASDTVTIFTLTVWTCASPYYLGTDLCFIRWLTEVFQSTGSTKA